MKNLTNNTISHSLAFTPRVVKWDSRELLAGLSAKDVTASPKLRRKVYHDLWGDMCAEYDAENLWKYLVASDLKFSPEFMACLGEWRSDERNHYFGLRQICSAMYDISEAEIDAQMSARIPDFTPISNFLTDEFRICVVLAYDELVSARGYQMFVKDFRKFGPRAYIKWVRWAARDESLHYQNFLDVIKSIHHSSIAHVEAVIEEIKEYESKQDMKYYATFLFDHTEETFERDFLRDCGQVVCKALHAG